MTPPIASIIHDATNHTRTGRVKSVGQVVVIRDHTGRVRHIKPENVRRGRPRPKRATRAERAAEAEARWQELLTKARGA